MGFSSREFNQYCYDRLLMDIVGGTVVEKIERYERIYVKICDVTEQCIIVEQPLITNIYHKIRKDYYDNVFRIIHEQGFEVGIDTLVMIFAETKMLMYMCEKQTHGHIFAMLICEEMWWIFDNFSKIWLFPTNGHRVKIDYRHFKSLTERGVRL